VKYVGGQWGAAADDPSPKAQLQSAGNALLSEGIPLKRGAFQLIQSTPQSQIIRSWTMPGSPVPQQSTRRRSRPLRNVARSAVL
jgi:hypothetical protein